MALKFITAEEAASFVHHDDNVGFSGFTPAGCPKVVPGAIAKKAIAEHEKGNPFQIGIPALRQATSWTANWLVPMQSNSVLRISPTRTCVPC